MQGRRQKAEGRSGVAWFSSFRHKAEGKGRTDRSGSVIRSAFWRRRSDLAYTFRLTTGTLLLSRHAEALLPSAFCLLPCLLLHALTHPRDRCSLARRLV